ncbi:MAG: TolC family protein [Gemmataceae bacterium]
MAQTAVLADPPKLDKPGAKCRFISLAEARAIALEHNDASMRLLSGVKPGSKSIVITGIPRDPRPAEFERNVDQILLNVENAYWNLYGSYYQLYSREQGLRFAYETWKITGAQFRVGRVSRAALAQAEGQYNLFRSQRLQAIDTLLDNERQLRAMLGLPIKDRTRLVPIEAPTLVEHKADWKEGWHRAMKKRPELYLARQHVEKARVEVQAKQLTGNIMQPKLELARAYLALKDQELKAERFLGLYYRRMSSAYSQIKAARAQREAFATQLRIRYELYKAGANEPGTLAPVTLDLLLESQRFWAESLATEYQAIVTYNNSICGWEFAKGDIMKHAHVRFGAEPPCDKEVVRAVAREHKRTLRHVRHELGVTADSPLSVLELCSAQTEAKVPSLPALWKVYPLLKDVSDVEVGLVEGRVSDFFPTRRVHGGVSP